MRTPRTVIVAALVVVAAVWAAWPAPAREEVRFTLPESLELEFPAGGIPSNVVCTAGRVIARRPVSFVFRWLLDPVSIEVAAVEGPFELRLGPSESGVWLQSDGTTLKLHTERGALEPLTLPAGFPTRVALSYADGAYRARFDGRDAGPRIESPPPPGPAALLLGADASMSALDCSGAEGISRHVESDPPPPGWERTAWAGLVALVGVLCLSGWWAQLTRAQPPGTLERAAALLATCTLVLGLPLAFAARNAARGAAPDLCDETTFVQSGTRRVEPGQPWTLPDRRDGDFRLRAHVQLLEGCVLDVLLRAGLPLVDRQLLATLSTDPALPSGVGRNLGTFLETEPASDELACLPAKRSLRFEVECRDDRMEAWIEGRSLGTVNDLDLRAGRTALHALSGAAMVTGLRLKPLGQPRSLQAALTGRACALGAVVLAALLLLAWPCGLRWSAVLWVWPLSAVVPPLLPEAGLWFAACTALLLLAPLVVRKALAGRVFAALLAGPVGVALAGASVWGLLEQPSQVSPAILNRLRTFDVAGEPASPAYAWARHPLCRRFNPYLRVQKFRDRKHSFAKPGGVQRLVALGSSSTYGYGVAAKDAWAAQLERLLVDAGRHVEVINAGVPGATAERLRHFLVGVLLPMQPDVVLVDLSFNDRSLGGIANERAHFLSMTTGGIGELERLLHRWRAVGRDREYDVYVQAIAEGLPVSDEDRECFSVAPARRFQDALRDLTAACRDAGVAVVFVQEPQRPGLDSTSLSDYHAAMAELGRELDVRVVAPQAALDAAPGPVFLDAVHPNRAGHEIIAQTIASALYLEGLAGR